MIPRTTDVGEVGVLVAGIGNDNDGQGNASPDAALSARLVGNPQRGGTQVRIFVCIWIASDIDVDVCMLDGYGMECVGRCGGVCVGESGTVIPAARYCTISKSRTCIVNK